jgi:hypothetical protein
MRGLAYFGPFNFAFNAFPLKTADLFWTRVRIYKVIELALAATCLGSSVRSVTEIAGQLSTRNQSLMSWIPYGYLVEILLLATLILIALVVQYQKGDPWVAVLWCCIGAMGALVLLGSWTIGGGFTSALLSASIAGVTATIRTRTHASEDRNFKRRMSSIASPAASQSPEHF